MAKLLWERGTDEDKGDALNPLVDEIENGDGDGDMYSARGRPDVDLDISSAVFSSKSGAVSNFDSSPKPTGTPRLGVPGNDLERCCT